MTTHFDFSYNNLCSSTWGPLCVRFVGFDDDVQLSVHFSFDIRNKYLKNIPNSYLVSCNGRTLTYPAKSSAINLSTRVKSFGRDSQCYFMHGLAPRVTFNNESLTDNYTVMNVAKTISDMNGRKLAFYTGAGISYGGLKPVWDHETLQKRLGLGNGAARLIDALLRYQRPMLNRIVNSLRSFSTQLMESRSTPAHGALAQIVRLKRGSVVLTENADMKHEIAEIRRNLIRLASGNEFKKIEKLAKSAELLITVGLSRDDRAVIQYMKMYKPSLKIIAFTLSKATIPEYLDGSDAVCLGDVQKTLPKLAACIRKIASTHRPTCKSS